MQLMKNSVLLLKSEKNEGLEDRFKTTLEEDGFLVQHLKTLDFNFTNLERLNNELENPDCYQGIIFTTPRSVYAVQKALGGKSLDVRFMNKDNYVVGETTEQTALNELQLRCQGRNSGNSGELAQIIIKEKYEKPFLYPCGNLKTETLINVLEQNEITVKTVTVYETIPSKSLEDDFSKATCNYINIPEYFVYFSPSGIRYTKQFLEKIGEVLHSIKFVAIGPTTKSAIIKENLEVFSVAAKPNPTELLSAIKQL